ncbi:hypothetical protein SERLADRAFT_381654 [Serpula lacrymans var. lacrymans S7.9]|uniref:Uncharacterized protein n=1 Tax=Serpula lacrymans var. lacrymans (strain S7.9) TaxID=578457 RepID=F8NPR8_SERL9|nr:uncharacterized protein SERLADRAFT_381654 [Serpula lacrymans var. lacrymans S7.9]EGO27224.1 hypothetical protein SERLADRAFT_381654 [Serpula lacrymans var. lacrymans S7.9]
MPNTRAILAWQTIPFPPRVSSKSVLKQRRRRTSNTPTCSNQAIPRTHSGVDPPNQGAYVREKAHVDILKSMCAHIYQEYMRAIIEMTAGYIVRLWLWVFGANIKSSDG